MDKGSFILGVLSESDIVWMRASGQVRSIQTGEVLIFAGQPLDTFYIILGGKLSVSVTLPEPKEIAQIGVGEVLGEMSFVDASMPSATVTAVEPSLVLAVPHQQLADRFQSDTGFAYRFYRAIALFLSTRLRNTIKQLGFD